MTVAELIEKLKGMPHDAIVLQHKVGERHGEEYYRLRDVKLHQWCNEFDGVTSEVLLNDYVE